MLQTNGCYSLFRDSVIVLSQLKCLIRSSVLKSNNTKGVQHNLSDFQQLFSEPRRRSRSIGRSRRLPRLGHRRSPNVLNVLVSVT